MVQTINETTSHIPLFFQDHLAAWRDGVGVCRQTFVRAVNEFDLC